jgi:hypothetical protein
MMAAGDCEVVGISDVDEDRCWDCAAKHYGPLRCERLRTGLEDHDDWWSGPRVYFQWQADEDAAERDCQCDDRPGGEDSECPRCCETLCVDCGKRLDRVPTGE